MAKNGERTRVRWVVLAGCFVVGLAEWTVFVVGNVHDIPGAYFLFALGTVALIGVAFEGWSAAIAAASFLGPFIAAASTTPRGDNDGLWGLIFPIIVFVAAIACVFVMVARRIVPSQRMQETTSRFVVAHLRIAWVVVVVAGLVTLQLFAARRRDPYPVLERIATQFHAPDSFDKINVRRLGDPLCDTSCTAYLEVEFATEEAPRQACKTAEASVRAWANTEVHSVPPLRNNFGDSEVCSWQIEHDGVGGYLTVSDEPEGTVARLTFFDPADPP